MNRDSIRINTNGQVPLADTGSGASGSVTGTERLAIQEATSANTASKIVARDASGNFSAGTVTANITGTASGLSAGADRTKLDTATNASSGDFDGWVVITGQKVWYKKVSLGTPPASPSWNVVTLTLPSGVAPNSGLQSLQVTLLGDSAASVHLLQVQSRVTSSFAGSTVDLIMGTYNNTANINSLLTTGYLLVTLITI